MREYVCACVRVCVCVGVSRYLKLDLVLGASGLYLLQP